MKSTPRHFGPQWEVMVQPALALWTTAPGTVWRTISMSSSSVACGTSPYSMELADRGFALMKAAYLASLDIRREGSAALDLCSAAAGRAGVYFELGLSLWDYAAGMLIVQEAGGVCCTIEGKAMPLDPSRPSVVAGGERAVRELLALAREIP